MRWMPACLASAAAAGPVRAAVRPSDSRTLRKLIHRFRRAETLLLGRLNDRLQFGVDLLDAALFGAELRVGEG